MVDRGSVEPAHDVTEEAWTAVTIGGPLGVVPRIILRRFAGSQRTVIIWVR